MTEKVILLGPEGAGSQRVENAGPRRFRIHMHEQTAILRAPVEVLTVKGVKLGAAPSVARLKAGAAAVPLPEGIAAALRDLERRAGYATPRLELLD